MKIISVQFSFSIVIGYALVFLLTGCSNNIEKADKLRLEGKYTDAIELYQKESDNGSAYAKWRLAQAYGDGRGVERDKKKALNLLKESTIEGCEEAFCDMAYVNIFGRYGVKENQEKGLNILKRLCAQTNNPYCITRYSWILYDGTDIDESNKVEALAILNRIKEKENPEYTYTLGMFNYLGLDDTPSNKEMAMTLFVDSYNNGCEEKGYVAYLIGDMYFKGLGDIERNIDKAVEWYNRGVGMLDTDCMKSLSKICLDEDTLFKKHYDVSRGINLLKKAGKLGDGDAYAELGVRYSYGKSVQKDDKKSIEYYNKAIDLKSAWGANNLGAAYQNGSGVEKNLNRAIELYRKAADWGNGRAAQNLYHIYNDKHSSRYNKKLAKTYLQLSADNNDEWGSYNLAMQYYYGNDLFDQNEHQAFAYMKQAADLGLVEACAQLAYYYENGIGCSTNPDLAKKYRDKTKAKEEMSNKTN